MSKIKEIRAQLTKNPLEYASIRFLVSKQIFITSATLYFLVYLFTVGGFYFGPFSINSLAIMRYHLYSLLVISVVFFGFAIVEYLTDKMAIKLIAFIVFSIFGLIALLSHTGLLG